MTMQKAALGAIFGVLLRAGFSFKTLLPLWGVADLPASVYLNPILPTILLPAAWVAYLLSVWRGNSNRPAALAAAALSVISAAIELWRQASTISFLSLDSLSLLAGGTLPALCWVVFLLHQAGWGSKPRAALWYLLLSALVQTAFAAMGITQSARQLAEFWQSDPHIWNLFALAVALLLYWVTQALFVRAAQKA